MTDGPHLPLRQAPLVQETEWGRHLLDLRIVACADHAYAERAPVTTRDKSYARQVWETVFACLLLVGAGALICWMGHV